MRLAHIVPISLLDCVPIEQHTHLVLSSLVLSEKRYSAFYAERAQRGDTLIVDNPVHEDRPVSITQWLKACEIIMPHIAVIPDVIDSTDDTVANAERAATEFTRCDFKNVELMAVPHAHTQDGWLDCALKLSRIPSITWFGISLERRLNDDAYALVRRRERVVMMSQNPALAQIRLHLLGVSESAVELGDDKVWQRAESTDASKFAVWNMVGFPQFPPVPIAETQPYPGRIAFGGGYQYFFAGQPQGLSRRKMRSNLRLWNNYSEREGD